MPNVLDDFLDRYPPTNGSAKAGSVPRYRSPRSLFADVPLDGAPSALRLSEEAAAALDAPLPAIDTDKTFIGSCVPHPNAVEEVRNHAEGQWGSEIHRATTLQIVETGMPQAAGAVNEYQQQQQREVCFRDRVNRNCTIMEARAGRAWDRGTLFRIVPLLLTIFIAGFGAYAELWNSKGFLQTSGLAFVKAPFAALCMAFCVVASLYAAMKAVDFVLDLDGKRRFRKVVAWTSLPLSLVTVCLFAAVIGQLHERIDIFKAAAWSPPQWVLFMAAMLTLGFTVATQSMRLSHEQLSWVEPVPHENKVRSESEGYTRSLSNASRGTAFTYSKLAAAKQRLEYDRKTFSDRCVAELHRQERALAAKLAQIQSELQTGDSSCDQDLDMPF